MRQPPRYIMRQVRELVPIKIGGMGKGFFPSRLVTASNLSWLPERITPKPPPCLPGNRFRARSGEAKCIIRFPKRLHPYPTLPCKMLDGLPQTLLRSHGQNDEVARLFGLWKPCSRLKASMGCLHQLLSERNVRPHQHVGMPHLSLRHRYPPGRRTPRHLGHGAAAVSSLASASRQ